MWEGACLEVLVVDGVRKTVGPVGEHDRRRVMFGLKEFGEVAVAGGDLLKGSTTRGIRTYQEWASDGIVVVGSEVRVIPVEAVLAIRGESVSEVAPWRNWVLMRAGEQVTP